jgi:hypothetical protein
MKEVRVQSQNPRGQYFQMCCDNGPLMSPICGFHSPSFRPCAARVGIQTALAATTGAACEDRLDSRPGLLSTGVTFFRGNDERIQSQSFSVDSEAYFK